MIGTNNPPVLTPATAPATEDDTLVALGKSEVKPTSRTHLASSLLSRLGSRMRKAEALHLTLIALTFLAIAFRLLYAGFLSGAIDGEGAEYARIAENLLHGNGYVGIGTPGEELMFPPLFPWLIAILSLITHSAEAAGRLISSVMGGLLVVPVYLFARRLFDDSSARIAALLTACHPLLIVFSGTPFSEMPYITLLLFGLYCASRAWDRQDWVLYPAAGVLLGLAYLTRPEGALYPLLTVFLLLALTVLRRRHQLRKTIFRSGMLIGAFLLVASPYAGWLSSEVGAFRWEGKTPINIATTAEFSGVGRAEAEFGVNKDLSETGVDLRSNRSVIRSTKMSIQDLTRIAASNSVHNIPIALGLVAGGLSFGSPILFGLAVLGLFGSPWKSVSILTELNLLMALCVPVFALLSIDFVAVRYCLLFLPIMIIWSAGGLQHVARWSNETARQLWRRPQLPADGYWGHISVTLAVAGVLLPSFAGTMHVSNLFDYRSQPVRVAGEWLGQHFRKPIRVMDSSTIIAYHAGGFWVPFPYADPATALEYADKRLVDVIVLREALPSPAPYWHVWLDNGIPSAHAELIYKGFERHNRILIYKWNRP